MASLRVTQSTVAATVLSGLQLNLARMQAIQAKMSSGKQLTRPSDSPSGVLDAMGHRSTIRRLNQQKTNADDGLGWLGTADQTLTSALNLVGRARDLAVGAGNGSLNASDREAMATEIDGLRASLLGLGNTRYGDRPIFAGTANVTDAYSPTGTYLGDNGTVERTVGDGARVTVNLTGTQVFGPPAGGGATLFDVLSSISAHLRSPDATQQAMVNSSDLSALDAGRTNVQNQLSIVGARYNRIETMKTRADDAITTTTQRLSDVEDIDLPKTIMELNLQSVAYQAALAAGSKVVQPSLVDFLR